LIIGDTPVRCAEVPAQHGAELAAAASKANPHIDEGFAGTVGNRIGRLFEGSGHSITGPIRAGSVSRSTR
jgi:hypothetical protein